MIMDLRCCMESYDFEENLHDEQKKRLEVI